MSVPLDTKPNDNSVLFNTLSLLPNYLVIKILRKKFHRFKMMLTINIR